MAIPCKTKVFYALVFVVGLASLVGFALYIGLYYPDLLLVKNATPPPAADEGKGKISPNGTTPDVSSSSGKSPASPDQKQQKAEDEGGKGAVAPPPPQKQNTTKVKHFSELYLSIGCVMSMMSFCVPIVVFWSVASAAAYYTKCDLVLASMSTLGWLAYAIFQQHEDNGKIIGVEAVISNSMGLAIMGIIVVIKVTKDGNMSAAVFCGSLFMFLTIFSVWIILAVTGMVHRDSQGAKIVSFSAAAFQIISQFLPLNTAHNLFWPPENACHLDIMNLKQLLILSRSINLIVSLYWTIYCFATYQYGIFMIANVVSSILCCISWIAHLMYALRPEPDGHSDEEEAKDKEEEDKEE